CRPSSSPPLASAWSAVSPATGKVAAWENVTFSGSSARACVGTATSEAHAPSGRKPTTRATARAPAAKAHDAGAGAGARAVRGGAIDHAGQIPTRAPPRGRHGRAPDLAAIER